MDNFKEGEDRKRLRLTSASLDSDLSLRNLHVQSMNSNPVKSRQYSDDTVFIPLLDGVFP